MLTLASQPPLSDLDLVASTSTEQPDRSCAYSADSELAVPPRGSVEPAAARPMLDAIDFSGMFCYKVEKMRLPESFRPNKYTVLCGKGKQYFDHIGNRRFRVLIGMYRDSYSLATTKNDKTAIVSKVVETIRSAGGAFVRLNKKEGRWYEIGDSQAREKAGSAFRDLLHFQYRSAGKQKTKHRQQKRVKAMEQSILSDPTLVVPLAAKSSNSSPAMVDPELVRETCETARSLLLDEDDNSSVVNSPSEEEQCVLTPEMFAI